MSVQFLVDGLVAGSVIGLGAVGVTLTYAILRFANFAHGEFVTAGAYATLLISGMIGSLMTGAMAPLGPLTITAALAAALPFGLALTGLLALGLDAEIGRAHV